MRLREEDIHSSALRLHPLPSPFDPTMGSPAVWGIGGLIVSFLLALWCIGLYQWHFAHAPSSGAGPFDPVKTWNWAVLEAGLLEKMATFKDVGANLNYLALSQSDAQFDLLFFTCDLMLWGFAAMRVVTPRPIFSYRLLMALILSLIASSFTQLPVPPHARGFPLLAYTRWGFYVDVLSAGRAVIGIEGWRYGGAVFGWVALALVPLMAIGTSAIGSAMASSVVSGVCVGALCSTLFHSYGKVEKRYFFTESSSFPQDQEEERDHPPSRPPPSIPERGHSPSPSELSAGSGLP